MHRSFIRILLFITFCFSPTTVLAQIVPDNTLGSESSTVRSLDELKSAIEGGAIRGDNLFHSFEEFGVGEGASVDFANPDGIANIFSRVTGSNVSEIFGSLGVDGSANLFLMNPNGIVFGENAAINVNGSFVATTAESIEFGNGDRFSANSLDKPQLTISFPIGLSMGSNSGNILIEGQQSNIVLRYPKNEFDRIAPSGGTTTSPNTDMSLVGGNVIFDGGGIETSGGNITIVAIDDNQLVEMNYQKELFDILPDQNLSFKNIVFENAAYLDTSSDLAGNVALIGKDISFSGGSGIVANTVNPTENAIDIDASGTLRLEGTSGQSNADKSFAEIEGIASDSSALEEIDNFYSTSFLAAYTLSDISEPQSNIRIDVNAKNLEMFDGAQIRSTGFNINSRSPGDILINSDEILIEGATETDGLVRSSIYGGNIKITANNLNVVDGARIVSDTANTDNSGNLSIVSDNIKLQGYIVKDPKNSITISTGLFVSPLRIAGEGSIDITTSNLSILDGAKILSNSSVNNDAGDINIKANSITVSGFAPLKNLSASTIGSSAGIGINVNLVIDRASQAGKKLADAGKIKIETKELKILDGARISSSSNIGNSGSIDITAENIKLDGTRPAQFEFIGGISTSTEPTSIGQGGSIRIDTNSLEVLNGQIIRAISLGSGDGGDITVNADRIKISGFDRFAPVPVVPERRSKINAAALTANGGTVSLNSNSIELDNLAIIGAASVEGEQGGNIVLQSSDLTLNRESQIEASAGGIGSGGNVTIDLDSLELSDRSQISASAGGSGNGGNITINSNTILGISNSDITANAVDGNGGNIEIDTQSILGLEARSRQTAFSDITASSEFGIDGTVNINSPESNTEEDAVVVFKNYIPQTERELISGTCLDPNRKNGGKLVYVGRGGVPENPYNFFDDEEIVAIEGVAKDKPANVGSQQGSKAQTKLTSKTNSGNSKPQVWSQGDPIVNANAVQVGADGQTYLVAETQLEDVQSQICSSANLKHSAR